MTNDIVRGNGNGFLTKEGKIAMVRCFECGRENYAMNVLSGRCTWCGYNANKALSEADKVLGEL